MSAVCIIVLPTHTHSHTHTQKGVIMSALDISSGCLIRKGMPLPRHLVQVYMVKYYVIRRVQVLPMKEVFGTPRDSHPTHNHTNCLILFGTEALNEIIF